MAISKSQLSNWLRTFLVLCRLPHLPTIWSNCLAGWLLSGGGDPWRFVALCLGATSLSLGGMFLGNAAHTLSESATRRGPLMQLANVRRETIWLWSLGLFGAGALILVSMGKTTAILAVILMGLTILYELFHKMFTFSPVIAGGCRVMIYLMAGSAATNGLYGLTVWCALALAVYVIGSGYIARRENTPDLPPRWPGCILAAPILLAIVVNGRGYIAIALVLSVGLGLWILRCLRYTYWTTTPNIGHTVSGLLAGIALVDFLAVAGGSLWLGAVFLLWFVTALVFQRLESAA